MTNAQFGEAQKLNDDLTHARRVCELLNSERGENNILSILGNQLHNYEALAAVELLQTYFQAEREKLEEKFTAL